MRNVEKLIVLLLLVAAVAIPACSEKGQNPSSSASPDMSASAPAPAGGQKDSPASLPQGAVTTPSGLSYADLVPGTGPQPEAGKPVTVHYTGWLVNGAKFDSSRDRKEPFSFVMGAGQVIPGWEEGVKTMKVGGKRKLVIPPNLAYGAAGAGGVVPPNATLVFEVELLSLGK